MTARILVAIAATLSLGACATNDIHAGTSAGRLTASSLAEASGGSQVRVVLEPDSVGLPPVSVAEYMNRQEAALRRELEGTGVKVERTGDEILLTLPGNITFATGNADIRSDFFDVLTSVSKVLSEYDRTLIRITGHTDSIGGDKINVPLSERRADSIAAYLRAQKISSNRISAYGYAARYPVASNDTPAGREQNRRVEILITPTEAGMAPSSLSQSSLAEADPVADDTSVQEPATDTPSADDDGSDLAVDAGQANVPPG